MNTNKPQRLDSLQALRAIAFLSILTYHCGLMPAGPWAVTVFFVLSGFVMYYSSGRKERYPNTLSADVKFAVHHVSKLYPLHIIIMLVVIIRESIKRGWFSQAWLRIAADALLLTSWFPPQLGLTSHSGVAWYLSTALFLYACFGMIYRLLGRATPQKACGLMIGTYAAQVLFLCLLLCFTELTEKTICWASYEFPLFRLGDFFIGCCLGKVFIEKEECARPCIPATVKETLCVVLIIGTMLIYVLKKGVLSIEPVRRSVLLLPSAAVTVYLFAEHKGKLTKLLTRPPLIWLASISGYGFLIHQEAIYQSKYFIFGPGAWGPSSQKVVILLVSFAVTILLSVIYMRITKWMRTLTSGSGCWRMMECGRNDRPRKRGR